METSVAEDGYIELDRTFHSLSEDSLPGGVIEPHSTSLKSRKSLSWDDVRKEFRVIILAEAGVGKTFEIRHQAELLRQLKHSAFFLRLEHIRTAADFQTAFEVGTFQEFSEWTMSDREGWLLLDSIDEAQLREPGDFERAILILRDILHNVLNRLHIVITGRTIFGHEFDCCRRHLEYTLPLVQPKGDYQRQEFLSDQDELEETSSDVASTAAPSNGFHFVTFDDLNDQQITNYVRSRGVEQVPEFLDAIVRADAQPFTARPQDLDDLIGFWKAEKRIGSRTEVIQYSIDNRLKERTHKRQNSRAISLERARTGVKMIAAAVTLGKNQTIRLPDSSGSSGIAAEEVLAGWNANEVTTLLTLPIFDQAIYGVTRFHHRLVREYLTAEWVSDLLEHASSRKQIEAILFRKQYDLDVVIPTMRPILPWLAGMNDTICQQLADCSPHLLLEGGDSRELPLEVRRKILFGACEKIAKGESIDSASFSAIQRFAKPDIASDVCSLIREYRSDSYIVCLLLRMIWLGELKGALPQAMSIAVAQDTESYTRIAAIRAVKAIGSTNDLELIRNALGKGTAEIERQVLAEVLVALKPTQTNIDWLINCLRQVKDSIRFSMDRVAIDAVVAFVQRTDDKLLPRIVTELRRLLDTSPISEKSNGDISLKCGWLMRPALIALERLLQLKHPFCLEEDAQSLLHKFLQWHPQEFDDFDQEQIDVQPLVRSWPEINRAHFWSESKRGIALRDTLTCIQGIDYRQFALPGLWGFDASDFDYACAQILERACPVEQRVALSLAFHLYVGGGRVRKQRELLKKIVRNNAPLCEDLDRRLKARLRKPKWGRNAAKHNRKHEALLKQNELSRIEWQNGLKNDPHSLLEHDAEPQATFHRLWYLYERLSEKREQSRGSRYGHAAWELLKGDFGDAVAAAYRDGAIDFWRRNTPQLRSEGAPPNSTPYFVALGLSGLAMEARQTANWAKTLSLKEAELAFRYASYEINGLPSWFQSLYETHSEILIRSIVQEIRWEVKTDKPEPDRFYLLSAFSSDGQWAWKELAPEICKILRTKEPAALRTLGYLLAILQESELDSAIIAQLARKKCSKVSDVQHAAVWFAVWVGVDPKEAIPALEDHLAQIQDHDRRTTLAARFVAHLVGSRREGPSHVRSQFKTAHHLRRLYLLMHEHIRVSDDINRSGKGAYSPGLRDEGQEARERLVEMIRNAEGKDAFLALNQLAHEHPVSSYRQWMSRIAKEKAEADADIEPWTPRQVREFHDSMEITPKNHRELFELVEMRLLDLKEDLENGDSSIATILRQGVQDETELRNYIGDELRRQSHGRYSVPQEEELADAKRPDLRLHGKGFDAPVPCELKIADNWSGSDLIERLENQLCGDYLRDRRSNRGIFLLVYFGNKPRKWKICGEKKTVTFANLVEHLQKHCLSILGRFNNIEQVEVIGIDLTLRLQGAQKQNQTGS